MSGFVAQPATGGFNNAIGIGALIAGGIGLAGKLVGNKTPLQKDVKAACGAKPLFNGKGQKDEYFACAERVTNASKAPAPQENKVNVPLVIGLGVAGLAVVGTVIYFVAR